MRIQQMFDLTGQVALITGGSRGLGLQMARALGEAGATVVITARKADELATAVDTLRGEGIQAFSAVNDLTQFDTLPPLVTDLLAQHGRLDILVNNAGTAWGARAEDTDVATWNRVMDLNLNGLFHLTREVGRQSFIPQRRGKVINIASVGGLFGNAPNTCLISYSVSKGAVVNLTRALAAEWGPHGVHVNGLCPGFFYTSMSERMLRAIEPTLLAKTPLRRIGGDNDLKGAVVFFASAASDYVTGQNLVVDGGSTITLMGDPVTSDAPH
jgi:NAD(P)-dependent dehydrogenase (short-subunit alcohol dehydrogenase family)